MTPDVIQFSCPACQSVLTVPLHLAGVTGPCPKCGHTVTSPAASTAPLAPPAHAAPAATPPPPAPVPAPAPAAPPSYPPAPTNNLPTFPPAPAWAAGLGASPTQASAPATSPTAASEPSSGLNLPPRKPQAPSLLDAQLGSTAPNPAISPSAGQSLPSLGGGDPTPPSLPPMGGLLNQSFPTSPSSAPPQEPAAPGDPAPSGSLLSNVLPTRRTEPLRPTDQQTETASKTNSASNRTRPALPPFPNRPSKGSSLVRFFIALVLLLSALALIGYFFAEPIKELYQTHIAPRLAETQNEDPNATELGIANPLDTPPPPPSDPIPLAAEQTAPPSDLNPAPAPMAADPAPAPPEVIQKAQPASTSSDTTLPKIEPLKPDGLMEVPQTTKTKEDPTEINLAPSPNFATVIPDPAKPAVDALIAFLAADTLDEKRKFILGADDPQVAKLIERYYSTHQPKPIPVTTIGFIRHDPNPEVGGGMQSVFMVASPDWQYPIPVMLQETKSGIKLDWIAFTEFKDDWLLKFVETFRPDPARFHVSIRRGHYFDRDVPDLDKKLCFFIQPPQEHFEVAVFVPKGTPLADMLARELSWGTQNAYVLAEIQWRKADQFKWVELTAVPQLNWHITIEPPPERK